MSIKYCKKCILPNTRPNLNIDEFGNCNCNFSEDAIEIDWEKREKLFYRLVQELKKNAENYHCVIPVSGGKDSTWQVAKALEFGLKPLCVTWKTPARTSLGQRNLDNLVSLGVDHVDITVNPKIEKIFTLKSFKRFGSPVVPMHMALHAIPMKIALEKNIPVILWGENSATEYGGDKRFKGFEINRAWLEKYGVTFGTTASDWIDDELTKQDLEIYSWPSEETLSENSIRGVFLGEYFKWQPRKIAEFAKLNGFVPETAPLVGDFEFADIDDAFLMAVHHWMKWYKFGFTRTWDNLSLDIRNQVVSRDEAIRKLEKIGNEMPFSAIEKFCNYVGISNEEFFEIANSFRNNQIWQQTNGVWQIKDFLLQKWDWVEYENQCK